MQEIPIDLFTGFMDSGKTTLIKETLLDNGFSDQGKSLIFISSEIEEMLRTCSKLVVLRDGQEVGEITEELTQGDRKSTRLNSSHPSRSRMPSSA